ncbi:MAG: hypothetical protein WBF90_10555 [Rivularia sp. (in: cyanobacteria)]
MRINLQKFTLSTLIFSLATTLAVGGFSESANAQQRSGGGRYNKSNVAPALIFEAFFEKDNGDPILEDESSKDDDEIGIFRDAIQLEQIILRPDVTLEGEELPELRDKVELFGDGGDGFDNSFNEETGIFNLSAKRQGDSIQYQIYQGDINSPKTGIRFAPINVSSFDNSLDLVNNIKDIIESSNNGKYGVEKNNGDFNQDGAGVLGLAINKSIRFIDEDTKDKEFEGNDPDILNIKLTPSQSTTSIPEPTTALASVFALAFAGKFLRKSKKSNA